MLTAWTNQIDTRSARWQNWKDSSQQRIPGQAIQLYITTNYYQSITLYYYILLQITLLRIASTLLPYFTSYYCKITLSITTYYYIKYYFVLLQNYFHITSTLLPINPKPSLVLLHITTQYITSYYYKITFILLHYYF